MNLDPSSLFPLVPIVVGVVAAARSLLPSIDGRVRVLLLAVAAAIACIVLVAAPGEPWPVLLQRAVLLGAMAFGGMTGIDRVGLALGKASSTSTAEAAAMLERLGTALAGGLPSPASAPAVTTVPPAPEGAP